MLNERIEKMDIHREKLNQTKKINEFKWRETKTSIASCATGKRPEAFLHNPLVFYTSLRLMGDATSMRFPDT